MSPKLTILTGHVTEITTLTTGAIQAVRVAGQTGTEVTEARHVVSTVLRVVTQTFHP